MKILGRLDATASWNRPLMPQLRTRELDKSYYCISCQRSLTVLQQATNFTVRITSSWAACNYVRLVCSFILFNLLYFLLPHVWWNKAVYMIDYCCIGAQFIAHRMTACVQANLNFELWPDSTPRQFVLKRDRARPPDLYDRRPSLCIVLPLSSVSVRAFVRINTRITNRLPRRLYISLYLSL